jgi:hypothetical protein
MTLPTASQTESPTTDSKLISLTTAQENYSNIISELNEVSSGISESVLFSETEFSQAKADLQDFVIKSQQLANRSTIKERAMRGLAKVPLIGQHAEESLRSIQRDKMNDTSISEIVDQLYSGIEARGVSLTNTINQWYNLVDKSTSLVANLSTLDAQLDTVLATELTGKERFNLTSVSSETKMTLASNLGTIQELQVLTTVGEGILKRIKQTMPASRAVLLNRLVMDAGVSQINNIHDEIQDIVAISDDINKVMQQNSHTAVMKMISSQVTSEKEIKSLTQGYDNRVKLHEDVNREVVKMIDNMQTTHTAISESMAKTSKALAANALIDLSSRETVQ